MKPSFEEFWEWFREHCCEGNSSQGYIDTNEPVELAFIIYVYFSNIMAENYATILAEKYAAAKRSNH